MKHLSFICNNGVIIYPIKKKQKWYYQVFCPQRGKFPPNQTHRTEMANKIEIELVANGFGGGNWR